MKRKNKLTLPVLAVEITSAPMYDNNPSGQSELPDDDLCGYRNPNTMNFVDNVADGESPLDNDVNVITANGVSNARGQGKNAQYNWGDGGTDGYWNKNRDWKGGNMTGQ